MLQSIPLVPVHPPDLTSISSALGGFSGLTNFIFYVFLSLWLFILFYLAVLSLMFYAGQSWLQRLRMMPAADDDNDFMMCKCVQIMQCLLYFILYKMV